MLLVIGLFSTYVINRPVTVPIVSNNQLLYLSITNNRQLQKFCKWSIQQLLCNVVYHDAML